MAWISRTLSRKVRGSDFFFSASRFRSPSTADPCNAPDDQPRCGYETGPHKWLSCDDAHLNTVVPVLRNRESDQSQKVSVEGKSRLNQAGAT